MSSESLAGTARPPQQEDHRPSSADRIADEELEAADWYQQRADDCEDAELKEILLHNMREEIEHASMLVEWLRRKSADFDAKLRSCLFRDGNILELEKGKPS